MSLWLIFCIDFYRRKINVFYLKKYLYINHFYLDLISEQQKELLKEFFYKRAFVIAVFSSDFLAKTRHAT